MDGESKWKCIENDNNCNFITIEKLMPETVYVFQVRGKIDDFEGPFGPISDDITTLESPSAGMLKDCWRISGNSPKIYHLPLKENRDARNNETRTKQLIMGLSNIVYFLIII